jgi:hypothetical protein
MRLLTRTVPAAIAVVLLAAAMALAAGSVTKSKTGSVTIRAGQTRTLTVPYPDALKYGNARYSGSWRLALLAPGASSGHAPNIAKVTILSTGPVEGGSAYAVRAHNANAAGSAPVRLEVSATTVEPLPHH